MSNGVPKSPDQLKDRQVISYGSTPTAVQWPFSHKGKTTNVRLTPRLSINNIHGMIAAAAAGYGIARVLSYQVEQEVQNGNLRLLLEKYEPSPIPVHIVYRDGRAVSSKLRAFIDLMTERLQSKDMLGT